MSVPGSEPGSGSAEAASDRIHLTLPTGWAGQAPTEAGKQQLLARLRDALASAELTGAVRDQVQRAATADLSKAFLQARTQGVTFIGSLVQEIDDTLVLIANVSVAVIVDAEVTSAIGVYGELLTSTEHDSIDLFELPAVGTGVRTVTGDLDPERPLLLAPTPLVLQYHLPLPDRGRVVVLTFTTPNGVLRREFGSLFDSIARSLRIDD